MRGTGYVGWLLAAVGVAFLAGGIAAGQAAFGVLMLAALTGSGVFMVWLARGWDKPLEGAEDLHRYGRPANATVRKVEDAKLDAQGTRTAKLSLQVTPRNEGSYKATQRVVLPGGRIPAVGETVTIKFDPNSRRRFVLLEESYEVMDSVQRAMARMQAT